jgi:hypothetical protein
MTALSLLLPTRGRREAAERFIASARDMAAQPGEIEVVLFVDEDDEESKCISCDDIRLVHIVGAPRSMGEYNTACLQRASGNIVMLVNDDVVIRTKGWDAAIGQLHASLDDQVYLAYPNDLFKGERVCTFPILSRRACQLLGDPFPAEYKGSFIDYHLLDIFQRLRHRNIQRIFYLESVIFEHMHYRLGKSAFDETYRRRSRFGDDCDFLRLVYRRRRDAGKLLRAIGREQVAELPLSMDTEVLNRASMLNASLLDPGLPLTWRLRLFAWFLGRRAAAHASRWAKSF